MIISIIAFYIILSLESQDIVKFLKRVERDAIKKLFSIIPVFYMFSLVIIFFLVYFATSILMEARRHEFGVYLTLGMKRTKLFLMLIIEDFRNNLIALAIGLPISILFSELIGLVTIKIVGIGILGHRFNVSYKAMIFTVIGFLIVKTLAIVILSMKVARSEISELLTYSSYGMKKHFSNIFHYFSFIMGVSFLTGAYTLGIKGISWRSASKMVITLAIGTLGTILVFYGLRSFISFLAKLGKGKLSIFNFRQLEEVVIKRSTIMAISSVLILFALCLIGAGFSIFIERSKTNHTVDFSFENRSIEGNKSRLDEIKSVLVKNKITNNFSHLIEIKYLYPQTKEPQNFESLTRELNKFKESSNRDDLIRLFYGRSLANLISISSYNQLREALNLEKINLKEDEALLYIDSKYMIDEAMLNLVLNQNVEIPINGTKIKLTNNVQRLNLSLKSSIVGSMAFIVNDKYFEKFTSEGYYSAVSGILKDDIVKDKGLINAIFEVQDELNKIKLENVSYAQSLGRDLFYTISTGYITIYLSLIFIVVANTMIGVQFLMSQRKTGRRYQTLIHLGADYKTLKKSADSQINWFFGLPLFFALTSSYFALHSLYKGIINSGELIRLDTKIKLAIIIILIVCLFETLYISLVKVSSRNYIRTLLEPKREE